MMLTYLGHKYTSGGYNNEECCFKTVFFRLVFTGPMSTTNYSNLSQQFETICSHVRNIALRKTK